MMSIYIYILSDKFNSILTRSESEKENNYLYLYLRLSNRIQSFTLALEGLQLPGSATVGDVL